MYFRKVKYTDAQYLLQFRDLKSNFTELNSLQTIMKPDDLSTVQGSVNAKNEVFIHHTKKLPPNYLLPAGTDNDPCDANEFTMSLIFKSTTKTQS